MDQVDYDKLLADATERRDDIAATPETSIYDEILQKDDEENNQRLMNSLFSVGGINPDQAAEAQKLGYELGVGPDVARRNMDEMRRQAALRKVQEYKLTVSSPVLARQLVDPEFAAIAQDDLEQLTGTEKTIRALKNAGGSLAAGFIAGDAGLAGALRMGAELYGQVGDLTGAALGYDVSGDNPAQSVAAWLADYQKRGNEAAGSYRPDRTRMGVVERGIYSGLESGIQMVSTLPTLLAGPEAYLAANIGIVVGQEYGKARDEGLAPLPATIYAGGQGAIEYATERLPLIKLLEDVGGGSGFLKTIGRQMVSEIRGEQAATVLQDLNEWAVLNPEKPFSAYLEERPSAAAETLIATMIATGGQTTLIKGAEAVFNYVDRAQADAYRAYLMTDGLRKLSESAANSKLRQRNPAAYQKYVAVQTEGTPVENLYIDAQQMTELLNQSNLTNGELDAMLPGVREQLTAAVLPGGNVVGDIVIPTSQYAAAVAGTDLGNAMMPHVRMGEQAMSQAEAEQFEGQKQQLVAEAAQVMDQKRETDKAFVKSAAEVEGTLFEQLMKTGVYTREQSRNAATLQAATYTMLASQMGMTPSEVFALIPYQQTREQPAATPRDTLSQAGSSLEQVTSAWDEAGISHAVSERNGTIILSKIVVPQGARGEGVGTSALEGLIAYADQTGQRIALSPSADFGGNKARLTEFYKRFGFTENKGRSRDLSVSETMIREPQGASGDTLSQRAVPQKPGKPVPESVDAASNVAGAFDFAASQTFKTNRDFKLAIQKRVLAAAKEAKIKLEEFTKGVEQYLARVAIKDAITALETNPNAVGWYNEKVTKALRIVSLIHPEVATSREAKFAFTWALAVTSNGLKVDKNFELAERVYSAFKTTGRMPTDIGAGQAQIAINDSLELFNTLIEKHGFDTVERFMTTKTTVKAAQEFTGKTVTGENLTTEVYGAAILGPKIGNGFFANLYGHFEQLTMDRWLMRTWGRWTGTLIEENKVQVKAKTAQLKALVKALSPEERKAFEAIIKVKLTAKPDELAKAITKASAKGENRVSMARIGKDNPDLQGKLVEILGEPVRGATRLSLGDELRKSGNALTKYLDGQKEQPSGPPERGRIRNVMNQALNVLQQQHPALTMSDLQALLWYPEKRLYDAAKTADDAAAGYEDDEAPDYANAAAALARSLGIPADQIEKTIKEVDDELQAAVSSRAAERSAGDGLLRQAVRRGEGGGPDRSGGVDERTGLQLNPDGTVTVYHHTSAAAAAAIAQSGRLSSAGEPDVYLTSRAETDTGYGDTAVAVRVRPERLELDDEFPNGRRDFRIHVGRPGGSVPIQLESDTLRQSSTLSQGWADVKQRIRAVISAALRPGHAPEKAVVAEVAPWLADAARSNGLDLTGYTHTIDGSAVRHVLKRHSDSATETARGQVAITESDLENIPDVITSPDSIAFGAKNDRRDVIAYAKRFPDGTVLYLEEVRTGRKNLALVTMRKYPAAKDFSFNEALLSYAQSDGGAGINVVAPPPGVNEPLRQQARGGYSPERLTTILNERSDVSTVMHEFSHFYLDVLTRLISHPSATPRMRADLQALVEFGGATMDEWTGWTAEYEATGKIPEGMRKVHEAVAYNTEIYLFEGKAPSLELQGVFERFVRWMRQVYTNIRDQLNAAYREEFGVDLPVLTGEVRQVFDRMLASEDEIKQAEAVRNMAPMFGTQAESGMSDPEWAAYQAMLEEARDAAVTDLTKASLRQMQWLSNARGRLLAQMQRQHKARRKEIREEVSEEVRKRPLYQAIEFLKRGKIDGVEVEYPVKLSIEEIEAMYGENPIVGLIKKTLGFGKFGMLGSENAMHPDQVAEMFGFKSGDALVRELLAAPSLRDAINAETDARMLAENGDMNTPEAREAAIEAALHSEARARFVAVELRFLEKATQPVRVMLKAAQQVAREAISKKVIKEIRPKEYSAAEARAAKKAVEAMKAGDSKAAARAKQAQLIQNQLAAEAVAARDEIDAALSSFRNLFKADKRIARGRNIDLVNAARAILAAYGIGKADKSPAEYTQQLRAYNPELYAELEPLILRASAGAKPYDTLTMDEFRLMRDAVDALWYQARRDNQIMVDGRKLALESVVKDLNTRLTEIGIPAEVPGEREAAGAKARMVRHLLQAKAQVRRVEHWADATDGPAGPGPFTKYIWRPMRQALDAYRADRNVYVKRYTELLEKVEWKVAKIAAPELGYTFGNANGGIGKAEVLGALLHTGNESNLRKLLLGRGWGSDLGKGRIDTRRWDAFRLRMISEGVITKADMDFVQAVWDLNEELKPQAQKAHHDLFGYYFKEVEPTAVSTPWGVYRGGYVPAKVDSFMVRDAQVHQKMEEMESDFRNSMPSTGMGFTKGRVEYNKPLSLDVRLIAKHIDDVIRFSHVQPVVKDVLRILREREFADNLTRIDPTVIEGMLLPWLNRAARQITSEAGRNKAVDKFFSKTRSRAGIAIMFANITNALQQVTGYFPALLKVKPSYLKNALVQYIGSPQVTTEEVSNLSPFMADRLTNQMFDLQDTMNDLVLNPTRYDKAQKWAAQHGYFLQQAFQNQVDVVTWVGSFNQTLAELGADKTDDEALREAVARADANVRLTQSSLAAEDISAFEVGSSLYKLFIQFSGYFNMMANLNASEYVKLFRDLGWRGNKGKLFMIYLLGFSLPMLVSEAIVRSLGGGWDDDDDDGYSDVFMSWFFGSQIRGALALVPGAGPSLNAVANWFDDKPYNDRLSISPAISLLEGAAYGTKQFVSNIVDPEKDVTGKNVRDVLTLVSLVTGIPVTVLGRPIGYQIDVSRDKIEPTSGFDYARGLITGKASAESRP